MTSRFVSGGTIAGDGPVDEEVRNAAAAEEAGGGKGPGNNKNAREWEAVQKDLDEERKRREEARRTNAEGGGGERSLYEILQANKAAKQAAFEEQNRIRNQFRALDDDEIDFLHGVSDERRAEEERVRRETEEGLADFREKQRVTATTAGGGNEDAVGVEDGNEEWGNTASGRKRKREKEREKGVLKGVKRRTSTGTKEEGKEKGGDEDAAAAAAAHERVKKPPSTATESATPKEVAVTAPAKANTTEKPKPKPALGLVDYGSDEDDD
ncbi:N-terminal domain of NEFA-interacting nuclear protein NIP30-domain-containing protein [Xylaria flabelliformis]|nr:N-terminal domain of NEFA-interacting nuclear protein NIP30-domain-containing protein [Xylaria flabelliformis]